MTHLSKRFLLLGAFACVLGVAQPAAAQVQPAGSGEPAYTSSAQNTQWLEWPATSGADGYRVKFDYYENNALVANPTYDMPNGASNQWANWSGVKTLQHGGQYGICAQGYWSLPNDSLFLPDGPNSCSGAPARPPRPHHDRPLQAEHGHHPRRRGGVHERRQGRHPSGLRRRRRRPVPGQLHVLPVRRDDNICDSNAGFIYGYNSGLLGAGGRRQVDDLHLHRRLRLGRERRAGRPRVGVRGRRRRVDPRQPERPGPAPGRGEGQPLRRQVRRGAARPHRAAGLDRPVAAAEVGELYPSPPRRPTPAPARLGLRLDLRRQQRRRLRRVREPHVHAGRAPTKCASRRRMPRATSAPRRRWSRSPRRQGNGGGSPGGGGGTGGGGTTASTAARPAAPRRRPGAPADDGARSAASR